MHLSERPILLVEDNQQDEILTIRALKRNNIHNEVIVARDGAEALDYLFTTSELPQIVLLDLKLPKIDGLEVLRRIRNHPATKRLPVIILTTSREDSDILTGYDLGANSYVRKPVDFEQFNSAIKNLGLYWLLINEYPPETQMTTTGKEDQKVS